MMKKRIFSTVVSALLLLLSACGSEQSPTAPVKAPPAEESKEAVAPAPQEAAPEAAAPAVAEADPTPAPVKGDLHEQLSGSSWKMGDFQVTFLDKENVLLKGGALINIMPKGLEAPYSYAEGSISISALGQTKTLLWDGEKLTMEGMAATRVQ